MKFYLIGAFVSLISVITFAGTTAEYIRANAVSMNDLSFLKEPSLTEGHTDSIVLQAVSASMPF